MTDSYEVLVLNQTFDIEHVQNLLVDGEKCEGVCYTSERTIRIESALLANPERYNRVVKHELLHAALGVSSISEMMELKMEEAICVMFESIEFSTLRED